MDRDICILGAASSIGIRPYDDGLEARHLDRAPATLRELGIVRQLAAEDLGDVTAPPYRDFVRPPDGVRNEQEIWDYSHSLANRVASGVAGGRFLVVLGGDCSIVLGSLLGATRGERIGLAYVDGHADFATPRESVTGSAASMCLAMAVGRGESPLARLAGPTPLVRPEDVVLIGRHDVGEALYGDAALRASAILDLPADQVTDEARAAASALDRLARRDLGGFWIHLDADVLDAAVMPAVDSPEPGGFDLDELAALVRPLARHPRALGIQVTIYDPALDPALACGRRLVTLLRQILVGGSEGGVK